MIDDIENMVDESEEDITEGMTPAQVSDAMDKPMRNKKG